ncbi:hypothetical protein OE88DRAFT_1649168 [Heliocybe sulcata]|uniref:Uncharacterized protein n=1 Tax=Heliocybe sulcata TaxID=5364 RepID=A0A5C3MK12_9AGAM|nr:hypothetical protein OE88DRAFT_1649168 [Heliocybe sulcata]
MSGVMSHSWAWHWHPRRGLMRLDPEPETWGRAMVSEMRLATGDGKIQECDLHKDTTLWIVPASIAILKKMRDRCGRCADDVQMTPARAKDVAAGEVIAAGEVMTAFSKWRLRHRRTRSSLSFTPTRDAELTLDCDLLRLGIWNVSEFIYA